MSSEKRWILHQITKYSISVTLSNKLRNGHWGISKSNLVITTLLLDFNGDQKRKKG